MLTFLHFKNSSAGGRKAENCKQIRFKIPSVPALFCDSSRLFSWEDQNRETVLV